MTHARPVHLHIDELVLAGFPARDRYRIQDAVQRALADMIGSGALELPAGVASRTIDATSPRVARLQTAATAGAIGGSIARAIVDSVGTAGTSGRGGPT